MYIEFERGQKHARKDADISDDHEAFKDAGWILEESDYVIDIDDVAKETLEKLIAYFNIKTQIVWTNRGVHFYFKKPTNFTRGANRVSPLGFKYEIKHKGNTQAVTIKQNGTLRKIENEGIREDPPFIFNSGKQFDILQGLEDGEGRNNALYKLRAKLGGQPGWRKILNFVNEYIFESPLSDDEMATLTREMYVEAEDDNQYQVATWLMDEFKFLKYGTGYYFEDKDGKYVSDEDRLIRKIYEKVGDKNTYYVKEVKAQMEARCKIEDTDQDFKIKFNNGYLKKGEFIPVLTDDFTPYSLDMDYNPEAEAVPMVDNYIDQLTDGDEEYRTLLMEILGHTLIVDPEFKRMLAKFFIFVGDGGNGKGTLLQIIKTILGSENITALSISEFTDERYLNTFMGKLANLGDDIQDQAIDDKAMKMLKNISTCDDISIRKLYENAQTSKFTGSLIFTSNHIIKSWEKGESYKRRVMWLPMYTKPKKKDPLFITKLTTKEALEYWIKLAVEGYKRLYKNGRFTESEIVKKFNEKYHEENNPALMYIEDMTKEDFDGKPVRDVYDDYEEWCEDNALKSSQNMIANTIEEAFGLIRGSSRINGKVTKCFKEK